MPDTEPNVAELRSDFLEKLRNRVDYAYENRSWDYTEPGKKNSKQTLEQAQRSQGAIIQKKEDIDAVLRQYGLEGYGVSDETILKFGPLRNAADSVYVENPHDYRDLLRMGFEKIIPEEKQDESVEKAIDKTLKHEFEHHAPGIGHKGLKIYYGLRFFTDISNGKVRMVPHIMATGEVTFEIHEDMRTAPEELSDADLQTA